MTKKKINRAKTVRLEKGKTQEQFADMLGYQNSSYISEMESREKVSPAYAKRIVGVYKNEDYKWLIGESNARTIKKYTEDIKVEIEDVPILNRDNGEIGIAPQACVTISDRYLYCLSSGKDDAEKSSIPQKYILVPFDEAERHVYPKGDTDDSNELARFLAEVKTYKEFIENEKEGQENASLKIDEAEILQMSREFRHKLYDMQSFIKLMKNYHGMD